MKTLNKKNQHEININIDSLPEWANYIAMDRNGIWFAYEEEPNIDTSYLSWDNYVSGDVVRLSISHKEKNWEESLYKIDRGMKNFKELLENKKISYAQCIREVSRLCYGLSVEAGWHDNPREVGTMLALIHSEVSEALEGFRKDINDDHLTHRKMAEVELADAVIRIFDLAGSQGFDIGSAMMEKLLYNTRRDDHKKENRDKQGGKKF